MSSGIEQPGKRSRPDWPFGLEIRVAALPAPEAGPTPALPAPIADPSTPPIRPGDRASLAVRSALAADLARLRDNEPAARRFDPEGVHRFRAAVRRLRSDLRTFRPLVDRSWAEDLSAGLRHLGHTLGAVRDLDVLRVRLERDATDLPRTTVLPLLLALDRRRDEARSALANWLDSPAHRDLLARLREAVRQPRLLPGADSPCRSALPALVASAWRRLRRSARRLRRGSPEADFHRARILAKRARFAAESVAPSLGRRHRRHALRFARRAARLQDALGQLQDAVMARCLIEQVLLAHPDDSGLRESALVLLARQQAAAKKARKRFPDAWARLDRKRLRRWLRGS